MKTLKLTLIALFSIGLLTAVLPSNDTDTDTVTETVNHELSKPSVDLTAFIEIRGKRKVPSQG